MAIRLLREGETESQVRARDLLTNNFNPQSVAVFPDQAVEMDEGCPLLSSEQFGNLSRDEKLTSQPILLKTESGEEFKALKVGEAYVKINPFVDGGNVFPMFSPNGKHIYLDKTDFSIASFHRGYRAILAGDGGRKGN